MKCKCFATESIIQLQDEINEFLSSIDIRDFSVTSLVDKNLVITTIFYEENK